MTLPETITRLAGYAAEEWLNQGVIAIDRLLGEGYARENPELLAAFVAASAAAARPRPVRRARRADAVA